jgi:hypothetical protein
MDDEQQSTGQSSDLATLAIGDPDPSEWAACLPDCQWADDGSAPESGRGTPEAIHANGWPHFGGRYIEHSPAPLLT